MVIANRVLGAQLSIFLSLGDGTFEAPVHFEFGSGLRGISTGDVDGDGDVDVLVAADFSVHLLRNDGQGNLAAPREVFDQAWRPENLVFSDMDGDGQEDILVMDEDRAAFAGNAGGGRFERLSYFLREESLPGFSPGIFFPADIDGSGGRAVVTIRTAAYKDGYLPSNIITHSYIFSDRVLSQPVRPAGFPAGWTGAPRADYEMDPQITDNPAYSASVREGLRSLPSMSIVARVADVFGSQGIYSNPGGTGVNWERPCSVEYILPDGSEGFQIDCGIRILGGASRNTSIPKHSFRLLFKSDYGRPRLKYELFEGNPVSSFDTLVLRANYNNSWVHWDGGQRRRAMLIRDQFAKDTTLDMGQPGAHGRFVNLYVGGLYWGVFNLVERPSAPFAADHMGGEKEEWDALNSGNAIDGNGTAWSQVHSASAGVGGDAARLLALREQLDIENLIDYLLL
ncbi:MAG: CotH kinase family protein, partial [Planctomycetes bacterium]|nr:CotH kinase family protein [Planctomycetota bacterium]